MTRIVPVFLRCQGRKKWGVRISSTPGAAPKRVHQVRGRRFESLQRPLGREGPTPRNGPETRRTGPEQTDGRHPGNGGEGRGPGPWRLMEGTSVRHEWASLRSPGRTRRGNGHAVSEGLNIHRCATLNAEGPVQTGLSSHTRKIRRISLSGPSPLPPSCTLRKAQGTRDGKGSMTDPRALVRRVSLVSVFCLVAGCLVFLGVTGASANSTTHYVDNTAPCPGSGTQASPWCDFSVVNSTTFQPGDQILLKRGDTFTPGMVLYGSGTSSNYLMIGSYGSGAAPVINGNGNTSSIGINLYNNSYVEIEYLAIENAGVGILIMMSRIKLAIDSCISICQGTARGFNHRAEANGYRQQCARARRGGSGEYP